MPDRIYIFDTTLRDGEQSPGVSLDHKEKVDIALQLSRLGVDVIEAGFPIASPGDFEGVRAIAQLVKGVTIAGLCRAVKADIDRTWEAVREAESPRIHTFLATSDIHLKYKLQKTRAEVLEQAAWAVSHAKKYCSDVEFSAEDASRSDFDYLVEVVTAVIEAGATVVNLPDTVGYAVPDEYARFISEIIARVPNSERAIFSVHCHDDLGMAVANSLAAIGAGARQVECTVNGIGERAGNASLEEIAMGLYTRKDIYQRYTGINHRELYRTSRLVSSLTGMMVQSNKAVVGKNAFAHESGIHQDGVLKERTTYEIMSPELVGLTTGTNLVLGKHSGRHAFHDRLVQLGYELSEDEIEKAFARFKSLADKKKEVTDDDLEAIVKEEIRKVPERYRLNYLHFMAGSTIIPTATVGLSIEGLVFEEAATGDGPVDASYRAVDKLTNMHGELLEFKLSAVTGGKDALGEVTVRVKLDGREYMGRGTSTDIIEASVRAYINAINKAVYYTAQHEAITNNQ